MSQQNPDDPDPRLREKTTAETVAHHFFESLNTGNLSLIDEVVAPDYTADLSGSQPLDH